MVAKPAENASRTTQTRARIKRALTELIREKGFDALTVSDLTRRAQINRGTFYLHFVDKYDLLTQLEGEVIDAMGAILLAPDAGAAGDDAGVSADTAGAPDAEPAAATAPDALFSYENTLAALEYVRSDLDFITAIASAEGDAQFQIALKELMQGLLAQRLACTGRAINTERYPEAYARELAVSHALVIIDLWLARGARESCEQIAQMIMVSQSVRPTDFIA